MLRPSDDYGVVSPTRGVLSYAQQQVLVSAADGILAARRPVRCRPVQMALVEGEGCGADYAGVGAEAGRDQRRERPPGAAEHQAAEAVSGGGQQ